MEKHIDMKLHFIILFLSAIFLASCGGDQTESSGPTNTPIPTYSFVQPTEAPEVATAAATITAVTLDTEVVERGRGRYEALECAGCHGENGEGSDQGGSLVTSTLSEEAFISFMRSGGTVGKDHQYATNRLSDSGGKNLYQYLLSLRQPE